MKYKVNTGTDLFNKFMELRKKIQAVDKAAYALAKELGFTTIRNRQFMLSGGISSFISNTKPEGYVFAFGSNYPNDFYPKRTKANQALFEKIEALPIVQFDELNKLVNYDPDKNIVGKRYIFHPVTSFKKDFVLLSFDQDQTKYVPVKDMVEITVSEYNRLDTLK